LSQATLAIDLGSTTTIAVIAQNDLSNKITIRGIGVEKTKGVNKGNITDIELASETIQQALNTAKNSSDEVEFEETVVSVSSAYTKGIRSAGTVNIPNGFISEAEINQVLQMALYNATIVPEYEVIQVLPIFFKVDDGNMVDNPLNMNGMRLEVSVYITTIKKTILANINNTFKNAGVDITNFVLAGYASAISLLNEEREKSGFCVLDIGGTTTDILVYKNNSIIYNDFLPIGSNHITTDLSKMLHTPPAAAEKLKTDYGTLIPDTEEEARTIRKIKIPIIGSQDDTKEMPLDMVQPIIHARVEEMLILAKERLESSGVMDKIGAGIVITGGMSELNGISELAGLVYEDIPLTVANPQNIQNGYMSFDNPTMATIVGLLKYSLAGRQVFELGSDKKLRKIVERHIKAPSVQSNPTPKITVSEKKPEKDKKAAIKDALPKVEKKQQTQTYPNDLKDLAANLEESNLELPKNAKKSGFWNKISEWF
jgi:cell division protein FtsA